MNLAFNGAFGAQVTISTVSEGLPNTWLLIEQHVQVGVNVTDRRRLGVLLPDTGLREPDVSSSSADDQEDRSCKRKCLQKDSKSKSETERDGRL